MEKIRAFIAVDIEDSAVINKISQIRNKFNGNWAKIKFVEDENLHLTLKFLGDVNESLLNQIIEKLSEITFKEFTYCLNGVGCFNLKFPRVLWVGIREGGETLISLHKKIDEKLSEISIKPDSKRYSPHLTIGRVKSVRDKKSLISMIKELEETEVGCLKATNFRLKKSILTPKGPIYEILREFKMEGN
ncbi:MAG: RNA 2',3'-cyclic phosphodiesterase [Candidatus Odinarchaeia archaeon]